LRKVLADLADPKTSLPYPPATGQHQNALQTPMNIKNFTAGLADMAHLAV
jgi:hypothetical protein